MKRFVNLCFKSLIVLAIFGSGYLTSKFINFPYFSIDKDISVTDLLSVITTILIAWYISVILEKQKEVSRKEKDLILRRVEDLYQLVDIGEQKAVSGAVPLPEVTANLKRISIMLTSIYNFLDHTAIKVDALIKPNIVQNIRKLRDLATTTPPVGLNSDPSMPVQVINGVIHFNTNRVNELETEFDLLKENVMHLEIAINKA